MTWRCCCPKLRCRSGIVYSVRIFGDMCRLLFRIEGRYTRSRWRRLKCSWGRCTSSIGWWTRSDILRSNTIWQPRKPDAITIHHSRNYSRGTIEAIWYFRLHFRIQRRTHRRKDGCHCTIPECRLGLHIQLCSVRLVLCTKFQKLGTMWWKTRGREWKQRCSVWWAL